MPSVNMKKDALLKLLCDTEMSFDQIGQFLNVSTRTVYLWLSKESIPQRHHKKLTDYADELKNAKLKNALDKAEIGMLIRAIEKRGFTVTVESKS